MVGAGEQCVALACTAMGTRFELLLHDGDAAALRSAGEAAIEEIGLWHNLLNAFDRASVVSRVNREAAELPVRIPPELAELLLWCEGVTAASGGAFDPSIGGLMRIAGFRSDPRAASEQEGLAGDERRVLLEHDDRAWRVRFRTPNVAMDFGAIGKGWALDRAAAVLRDCGVASALLHGGTSSIITIGADWSGAPWRVSLGGGDAIELVDEALGLSAPTGRVISGGDGVVHGHILDPRTGQSAERVAGAVVAGPSAALCDAWSTALVVEPALANSPGWPDGYRAMLSESPGVWQPCSGRAAEARASERTHKAGSVH